ncbi:MAG: hypothetical protein JXK16_11720 [Thiotrichales bacterium]|nr:hypothetical protein [Thiotrichales bacterium]
MKKIQLKLGWSVCFFFPLLAFGETIKLTSLEWPPYNGEYLEHQGSNTAKLRTLLKQAGYDLEVTFLPWKRAVSSGLEK